MAEQNITVKIEPPDETRHSWLPGVEEYREAFNNLLAAQDALNAFRTATPMNAATEPAHKFYEALLLALAQTLKYAHTKSGPFG